MYCTNLNIAQNKYWKRYSGQFSLFIFTNQQTVAGLFIHPCVTAVSVLYCSELTGQTVVQKTLKTFPFWKYVTVGRALPSMKFVYGSTLGSNFSRILECIPVTFHLFIHWGVCQSVHLIQSGLALRRHQPVLLYRKFCTSVGCLKSLLCVVTQPLSWYNIAPPKG